MKCTPKVGNNFWRYTFFMSKLNLERKAEIVAHYMNTSDGYKNTAKKFGISDSTVERLVAQFKTNGIKGLTQKNGTYSGKFKLYVLKYQKHNNLSDKETAVYFKIPSIGTISVWRMKYLKGGYELLCRDGRGKPKNMATKKTKKNTEPKTELEKLREENQWLRMENAILKKLNALIQEEEESEQETKQMSSEI